MPAASRPAAIWSAILRRECKNLEASFLSSGNRRNAVRQPQLHALTDKRTLPEMLGAASTAPFVDKGTTNCSLPSMTSL